MKPSASLMKRKTTVVAVAVYVLSLLAWPLIAGLSVMGLGSVGSGSAGPSPLFWAGLLLALAYPFYGLVGLIAAWRSGRAAWHWLLAPSLVIVVVCLVGIICYVFFLAKQALFPS
jgi:hypothetical protein